MFTGKEEHRISLDHASRLTKRYRASRPKDGIKGCYFSRKAFEEILAQGKCVGIRMYFGEYEDGNTALVLVGVTEDGNDIDQGVMVNEGFPCPPYCGVQDPLNS